MKGKYLQDKLLCVEQIKSKLKKIPKIEDKVLFLKSLPVVVKFLKENIFFESLLAELSLEHKLVAGMVVAIGQGNQVFKSQGATSLNKDILNKDVILKMLEDLSQVEKFYAPLGGLIGYQYNVLKLLREKTETDEQTKATKDKRQKLSKYFPPFGEPIDKYNDQVKRYTYQGIKALPHFVELYTVGGACDRLGWRNEEGQSLPAAKFPIMGITLLEWLIRSLQAREYLYYKLFKKQCKIPIVMMTSTVKDNHSHINEICRDSNWFGRGKENFLLCPQISVPTVDSNGDWVLYKPYTLLLKPGGHGVVWKLISEVSVANWLSKRQASKMLVRQINNLIAGEDYGLLAFAGVGIDKNKKFGFASCQRMVGAAEGMNVLIKRQKQKNYEYTLSNIEYVNFKNQGIKDIPISKGGEYSRFPSNTNILFADVKSVLKAVKKLPFPGMLLNMKDTLKSSKGKAKRQVGRLETTMQNIADCFVYKGSYQLKEIDKEKFPCYLTYNKRLKTISAVKKCYSEGESFLETPQGCFYDFLNNQRELLHHHCKMRLPKLVEAGAYLTKGPNFIARIHYAAGPLYSIIGQKIRGGSLKEGAEIQLDLAEINFENLKIAGSLLVSGNNIMGAVDRKGVLQYGENTGKCFLKDVEVINAGIDRRAANIYWQNNIARTELCRIEIEDSGEFYAYGVIFQGNIEIKVPSGMRVTAYMEKGEIKYTYEKIAKPTWYWKYAFDSRKGVILKCKYFKELSKRIIEKKIKDHV